MTSLRIAVLSDIHGNLPALDAVLAEVGEPDLLVSCGDVVSGPMPAEVLDRLRALEVPVRWVMGNADRSVVHAFDTGEDAGHGDLWVAGQLDRRQRDVLAGFEGTVEVEGIVFCHGTPRSDEEIVSAISPVERLREVYSDVDAPIVVGGHTHQQFDRRVDDLRVLNPGSVGMPYEGIAAAFWMEIVDGEPRLRRTDYDVPAAVAVIRATGFPDVEEGFLRESLVEPADRGWVSRFHESRVTIG